MAPFRPANLTRRAGLLGAAAALGGCGFHPLYAPAGRANTPADAELAAIYVAVMAERSGQLLRQALQRRLDGNGAAVTKKYELIGGMSVGGEGIGIQRDNSSTRIRNIATSVWGLTMLDPAHTAVTSGTNKAVDGYNILNQQFFAADLESDASQRRLAEALADQIVQRLAIFFRSRAEAAA